jgi:hypothetical protein
MTTMTNTTAKPARNVSPDKKSGKPVAGEVRPVAKSLHTLTVLLQVARLHMKDGASAELGLLRAVDTLGLNDRPDPYGLVDRALTLLKAA